MMTLTSVHIAKTSKNNELRWRFFIYGFVLIFPQALLNLLDANDFKDVRVLIQFCLSLFSPLSQINIPNNFTDDQKKMS